MPQTPSDTNTENPPKDSSSSGSSWSSWFVSPAVLKQRFQEFDDRQRINRLSECRKLDKILNDCRKRNQPGKPKTRYTTKKDEDDPIESVSIGVRNMKYFGWRGILKSSTPPSQSADGEASDDKKNDTAPEGPDLSVLRPQIRSSCAREEHAVWACRAIATGCGKDLSELKKCFEDVNEEDASSHFPPHVRVLTSSYTNYQGIVEKVGDSKMKSQIPCHEIQRRLGSCVTGNGKQ
eukprot:CAMPEP_0116143420 /NCGR_PEP_ID=MMETSP0329-20121206/15444_1 /TAXON_ID=697910 /ORGANISM="Pseudo-nitzschia arenysensis, Strain B593" /LENGTH=234 /DNA_ID=CAMNT_0003638745 /DNA_START=34 /DNA_END=735 /DNA_ORIENTATION=+